ncbi:fibrinogen-like protein 1 [Elysia marginata]|uniref:Fibrinogen-like protein 1 n=1 Tax=Elysia marginata TaxID=1093978 RepID=A0AAV4HAV9_9GAST|nr:fibrinogen-like protein 1 [Elysia marginata]
MHVSHRCIGGKGMGSDLNMQAGLKSFNNQRSQIAAGSCKERTYYGSSFSGGRRLFCAFLFLPLLCVAVSQETAAAKKTVTTSTKSDLCTYTLVVHEFDTSRCTAYKPEYVLADGADRQRPHDDAPSAYSSSAEKGKRRRPRPSDTGAGKGRTSGNSPQDEDSPELGTMLKDVENKLLEEMVRNRALNSTLSRHEALLQEARNTLESYRSNFTSVFYQMMQVERKLHRQRRINRSLNKKLSNVILDVVEVNNVISKKLPASGAPVDGNAGGKHFAVESSSSIRACPGISNVTKQHEAIYAISISDNKFIETVWTTRPERKTCLTRNASGKNVTQGSPLDKVHYHYRSFVSGKPLECLQSR